MAEKVDRSYGNERGEKRGCNRRGLSAGGVEIEGEKADRDMEHFAGNLMPVYLIDLEFSDSPEDRGLGEAYKGAPLSMYRYDA